MQKQPGLFFSIAVVILICFGISIYINKILSTIDKNLTNEYHEVYRHSSKLQLDITKFRVALGTFTIDKDNKSHEKLQEFLDLIFLRMNVVSNSANRMNPEDARMIQLFYPPLEKIESLILMEKDETYNKIGSISSELEKILIVSRKFAHRVDTIVQKSIANTSKELNAQAIRIVIFLSLLGIVSIAVAVLFYKQRESAIEMNKLRNYLFSIINSMPSMLIGVDKDGVITQWNFKAEQVTGLSAKEVAGQSLDHVAPSLSPAMAKARKAIETGQKLADLKRSRKINGDTTIEDMIVYPLISSGLKDAVILIDDVTEQVRMEEMMIQSEKMLSMGGLAAGMAHEINNPLAGMIQSADVLGRRLTDHAMPANIKAAESVGIDMDRITAFMKKRGIPGMISSIRESGQRVAEIVENMLSFSRKNDSTLTSHDPAELMNKTLALAITDYDLKKHYDFKTIRIEKNYEPDLPLIPCEGAKIQQVLLNIFGNGAQAMQEADPKGDHCFSLGLSHEKEAGMVRFEIQDNGPGMDKATRKRVFEPFFTTKPVGVGTGLGLSISYFIITENHKGSMEVQTNPGGGACFIIRLPVSPKKVKEKLDQDI